MNDIILKADDCVCAFRSVGVLVRNGRVLLQREKDGNEYAFPGGTVKLGESTMETLLREWKEELGAKIEIEKFLWSEESFWRLDGKIRQTICFYYLIGLTGNTKLPSAQRDNDNIVFEWKTLEELSKLILYPVFASFELQNIDNRPKHFILRESEY